MMNVKNIWPVVKNRYRLSPKNQMHFEFSFPKFVIGKCCFTMNNAYQIRTQKISPSIQGLVFSDTIPLSWFTSSVLIPWTKIQEMTIADTVSSIAGLLNTYLSSQLNKQTLDSEYCALRLKDPGEITIDLPWSKDLTDYVYRKKLFNLNPYEPSFGQ